MCEKLTRRCGDAEGSGPGAGASCQCSSGSRLIVAFGCGGELREIVADGAPSAMECFTRDGRGKRPRGLPQSWVLLCPSTKVNIQLCPRLQELRKFLDAQRQGMKLEDLPAWLANFEPDLANGDGNGTHVDYFDAQAVIAIAGNKVTRADTQTCPVAENDTRGVEHAKHGTEERDGECDALQHRDVDGHKKPLSLKGQDNQGRSRCEEQKEANNG